MFADIRTEWRVNDVERALQQKADRHELSSTNSDVDRLEHAFREANSDNVWLRGELQRQEGRLIALEQLVAEMQAAKEGK